MICHFYSVARDSAQVACYERSVVMTLGPDSVSIVLLV